MERDIKSNSHSSSSILTMSPARSLGSTKLTPGQDSSSNNTIMAIGSALVVPPVESAVVRDSDLTAVSTSISSNMEDLPNNSSTAAGSGKASNAGKATTSTTLTVNNILADADNAAMAAQTIALPQGTLGGSTTNGGGGTVGIMNSVLQSSVAAAAAATSNASAENSGAKSSTATVFHGNTTSSTMGNNNNHHLNQYILASAGVPSSLSTIAPAYNSNGTFNAPAAPMATAATATSDANPNQDLQSAILQQNAAIMQQNAATLLNLHQTNKLLAATTGEATLGMLAPIMNMTNPVQLLQAGNPAANSFLPATTTNLPAPVTDFNGAFATAPIGIQQQQQQPPAQPGGIPIPAATTAAQLGTIAIAPGATPHTFPMATGFANNGIVNTVDTNNTDAVQNILRTAFMLQNSGLPFLPQGMMQQSSPPLIPAQAGGLLLVPNNATSATNTTAAPFRVVPATVPVAAQGNSIGNSTNSNGSNTSKKQSSDVGNNGNGAAAAANAAASVLPPASMNLPLHQQLQHQHQHQQQLQHLQPIPQMGMDLNNTTSNNAIALLGGTPLSNSDTNGLQIAGITTFQQQQRNQAMMFPPMNLSDPNSQLALPLGAPQQKQQLSNPSAVELNPQQQPPPKSTTQKKHTSISRPLYLDHDSNCLTAYQCFLRKQIELFEVGHDEMTGTAQGRNTPLHYGQVGIRCRHCAHLPKAARARGGVYYSRTIDGVYQVAQNMSKLHFLKACTLIPDSTKNQLKSLQSVSSRASGGKEYWAEGLRVLGIVEEGGMLRFASNSTSSSSAQNSSSKSTE